MVVIIFHVSFVIFHCRASDEVSTESGSDRVSINSRLPGCEPVATALDTDFIATNDNVKWKMKAPAVKYTGSS